MGEWKLKNSYLWNDLALGSVETYFLEVGACVSLKKNDQRCLVGLFLLNWMKISLFSKFINGEIGTKKTFFNWNGLVLASVEIFFLEFDAKCFSEKSHQRCLIGLFLLNWVKISHFWSLWIREWDLKTSFLL